MPDDDGLRLLWCRGCGSLQVGPHSGAGLRDVAGACYTLRPDGPMCLTILEEAPDDLQAVWRLAGVAAARAAAGDRWRRP